jgi:hypothetical protein
MLKENYILGVRKKKNVEYRCFGQFGHYDL